VIIEFATGQIRVRCTYGEYEDLVRGRSVELDASLPRRHRIVFSLGSTLTGDWRLDADPTGVWLSLPRSELADGNPLPELTHDFAIDPGTSVRVRVEFTAPPGLDSTA
jgi:hypothetical protein